MPTRAGEVKRRNPIPTRVERGRRSETRLCLPLVFRGEPLSNIYEPSALEPRWQAFWEERGVFRAANPGDADFDPEQPK